MRRLAGKYGLAHYIKTKKLSDKPQPENNFHPEALDARWFNSRSFCWNLIFILDSSNSRTAVESIEHYLLRWAARKALLTHDDDKQRA